MGLMLVTTERMSELENEVESYKKGMEHMVKAHDRAVKSYRELRDSKDAEIADLHVVIEDLKQQVRERDKENKRLRQVIAYYEGKKKCSS